MDFLYFDTIDKKFKSRDYMLELTLDGSSSTYYVSDYDKNQTINRLLENGFTINSVTEFNPTEDVNERLELVNSVLTEENVRLYITYTNEVCLFVNYGYVSPDSKLEELKVQSINYYNTYRTKFVEDISKTLGYVRKEKEYGGIKTSLGYVETDVVSQGKISALYQANQVPGLLEETTPFKMADGTFNELTKEDIDVLYTKVARLIQSCFNAENRCLNLIKQMNDADLIEMWKDSSKVKDFFYENYK